MDTPTTKKPRRPSLTRQRLQAIDHVAALLRPRADARNDRGGLFGESKESAAMIRAFVEWADAMKQHRERRS